MSVPEEYYTVKEYIQKHEPELLDIYLDPENALLEEEEAVRRKCGEFHAVWRQRPDGSLEYPLAALIAR